jgi:PKD repeat protein
MGRITKSNRFWILCVVFLCATLMLVSAVAGATRATVVVKARVIPLLPVAGFTAIPSSGNYPLTVMFTDASTGGTPDSWLWDFNNDGTVDATGKGPHTYIYTSANTYTAKLTVTNAAGSSTASTTITVNPPPMPLTAAFTATQTTCACSWKVTFNDISTGSPTSRTWAYQKVGATTWTTFGSGTKTPTLSFSTSASYNIKLEVKNAAGNSNTLIKTITPGNLKAGFSASTTRGIIPLTVTFTDTSVGMPTSWKWEYQKKGTTTWTTFASGTGAQNPSFSPTTSGKYSIRLTVTNTATPACGSNTMTKTDYITVTSPCDPVVASFSGSKTSGNKPLTVKFTDSSTGPIVSWQWDFQNDGTYDSTLQNPSFKYDTAGKYSVKLTVKNACPSGISTSTLIKSNYIIVK